MARRVVLGIDTSNYKTSAAIAADDGTILCDCRRFLDVPENERGLRQQNALFQHVVHLPELIEQAVREAQIEPAQLAAVSVSTRPRPVERSYMPVFLAGEGTARSIAAAMQIPLICVSHQEGHIRAAAASSGLKQIPERLISFHFSGGTTEAVLIDWTKKNRQEQDWYRKVGGTEDLAAGQAIDRIGVQMGFPFPCGQYLDEIAMAAEDFSIPDTELFRLSSVGCRDGYVHFSGLETDCGRRMERIMEADSSSLKQTLGQDMLSSPDQTLADLFLSSKISGPYRQKAAALLTRLLMQRITRAAARMTCDLAETYGVQDFLLAGGVASSSYMRAHFHEELKRAVEKKRKAKMHAGAYRIWFGSRELSSDNAAGVALLGLDEVRRQGVGKKGQ